MNEMNNRNTWIIIGVVALVLMILACCVACFVAALGAMAFNARAVPQYEQLEPPHVLPPEPIEPPELPEPFEFDTGAWLGVRFVTASEGAQIVEIVPGSPADRSNLQVGDVIIEVDGDDVKASHPLNELIQRYEPGDRVELTVLRRGHEREIEVYLGVRPLTLPGDED